MKTLTRIFLSLAILGIARIGNAQSWHYTGSLSVDKQEFTMTALNDGRALVTGGLNGDGNARSECELYNPATGTWSVTNPLTVARTLHTAVKLKDGRVAVFGGQIGFVMGGSVVQTAKIEIFDPSTNIWSDGGSLQAPRQHHTTSLLPDGRVLLAAGLNGGSPTELCEIYDPSTSTSTLVAPLKLARYEAQATSLSDGRVMVSGGRNGGWNGNYFSECEIYDPSSDTWTVEANMNQSRMRALLVQFSDGSILSAAGRNSPTSTAPGSELFDLSTGLWTSTDPMKLPCTWMGPVLLPGDHYLVTGGFYDAAWSSSSTQVTCTATTEWYDKHNAKWYYAPEMEQARGRHQAVYLHQTVNDTLPTDFVLVAGGIITGNNIYTNTCEVLDIGYGALANYRVLPSNAPLASVAQTGSSASAKVVYDGMNPVIEYSTTDAASMSIDLVSTGGQQITTYNASVSTAGTYDFSLKTTNLPSGAYLAVLHSGRAVQTLKVIVIH